MVYSSMVFLSAFMPTFFLVYYLLPSRDLRNCWLLLGSLVFYAWGEPRYVFLMLCSILVNWALALRVEVAAGTKRRALLALCITANLLVLGFFKYEGFLARNVNALLGDAVVPIFEVSLPVGISFYTLQALSYVVDVYRGKVPAQRNIIHLGVYISMFPQLVAGPIVRYSDVSEQLVNREESLGKIASGLRLFVIGLAKKALLANVVGAFATEMMSKGGQSIGLVGP